MSTDPDIGKGYTPEYSDELFTLIIDLYKDEIKPHLNDLKLHKMIDLIEVGEYNFEKYQSCSQGNEYKKSLKYYIVGLFYIYLIIPNSIQFQIKNKNYEIFIFLKQLFEKELQMSNVMSITINYIGYLNEHFEINRIESIRSRDRSNTLPSSALHQDLSSLLNKESNTTSISTIPGSQSSSDSSSTNSSIVEDLWSPPDLQPNDQLKLVSDNYSTDSLNKIPEAPSHPPPAPPSEETEPIPPSYPAPKPGKIHHANTLPLNFQPISLDPAAQQGPVDYDIPTEDYLKRRHGLRKDSHSSVYVNEDDSEFTNIPTITPSQLFDELKSGESFSLMFDLRKRESFGINHIDYDNNINIDPSLLNEINDFQELKDLLKASLKDGDYLKFKNFKSFERIVMYTDNKNFLAFEFDYLLKFRNLLNINSIEILKGGFDSWLKYVSKNHSSEILKFKAKRFPISAPPSIPVPAPPTTSSSPSPIPAPYDYSRLLPDIQDGIQPNNTTSKVGAAPPVPPHHHHLNYPRAQHPIPQPIPTITEGQNYTQPFNGSYQQPQPRNQQQYFQGYPQQNYPQQQYYPQQYYHQQYSYPPQQPPPQQQHAIVHSRARADSIPTLQKSADPFSRLSITGLRNMGNTCYINSMIQCLFATSKFRDIFLDGKYSDYVNPNFKKQKISSTLATLFKKMYLNGGCSIVPSGFLKNCVQLRPDLKIPNEQQDTQEFLMFLLDQLHDELSNSNNVVNDYPDLMAYDSSMGEDYSKWVESLIKQGLSPISEIFQGQLKDSLRCMNCGFESSNFSTFYMLSLVIPKIDNRGRKLKKIQLEDCIKLFTNEEILTGDNAWDCPKCSNGSTASLDAKGTDSSRSGRKHRLHLGNGFKFRTRSSSPAGTSKKPSSMSTKKSSSKSIKSLNFVKLPPVLVIHLSRFLFYDLNTKDTSIVQYPLILEFSFNNTIVKYKLFGVVNHYGTLKSGHYTSITNKSLNHDLHSPKWYYFDDEVVKTTNHGDTNSGSNSHLSSSDVYVLFYERVN